MGGNFSINWSELILSALFLFKPKCYILRGEMDAEKSSQQWLTIGLSVAAEGLCPTRKGSLKSEEGRVSHSILQPWKWV